MLNVKSFESNNLITIRLQILKQLIKIMRSVISFVNFELVSIMRCDELRLNYSLYKVTVKSCSSFNQENYDSNEYFILINRSVRTARRGLENV